MFVHKRTLLLSLPMLAGALDRRRAEPSRARSDRESGAHRCDHHSHARRTLRRRCKSQASRTGPAPIAAPIPTTYKNRAQIRTRSGASSSRTASVAVEARDGRQVKNIGTDVIENGRKRWASTRARVKPRQLRSTISPKRQLNGTRRRMN